MSMRSRAALDSDGQLGVAPDQGHDRPGSCFLLMAGAPLAMLAIVIFGEVREFVAIFSSTLAISFAVAGAALTDDKRWLLFDCRSETRPATRMQANRFHGSVISRLDLLQGRWVIEGLH